MRKILVASLALGILFVAAQPAHAQSRPLGLGLELGDPSGLALKYYMGGKMALQGGVGWVGWGDEGVHLHLEAVWHPVILTRQAGFTMPLYLGIGGRLINHHDDYWDHDDRYDHEDTHLGAHAPLGILFDFHKVPIDLFLQIALSLDVIHFDNDDDGWDDDHWLHLGGAFGARYYF